MRMTFSHYVSELCAIISRNPGLHYRELLAEFGKGTPVGKGTPEHFHKVLDYAIKVGRVNETDLGFVLTANDKRSAANREAAKRKSGNHNTVVDARKVAARNGGGHALSPEMPPWVESAHERQRERNLSVPSARPQWAQQPLAGMWFARPEVNNPPHFDWIGQIIAMVGPSYVLAQRYDCTVRDIKKHCRLVSIETVITEQWRLVSEKAEWDELIDEAIDEGRRIVEVDRLARGIR